MRILAAVIAVLLFPSVCFSQALDIPGAIRQGVLAKYHLTQATADHTDVVTAGDVITLLKSGLVMYGLQNSQSRNGNVSYHDGKLNAGGMTKFSMLGPHDSDALRARSFVSGEKCWLIDVSVKDDGLYLRFLSDPINDLRYMGSIKFPFDKKQPMTSADAVLASVAEVISSSPLPNGPAAASGPSAPSAPAAPTAPLPAIAPPPPPPDQPAAPPPTISLGQSRDQVIASFGQPTKIVKLGTKEIDTFKDMKVTFVNGKVTDVQ